MIYIIITAHIPTTNFTARYDSDPGGNSNKSLLFITQTTPSYGCLSRFDIGAYQY